jgi:hypothetical protein
MYFSNKKHLKNTLQHNEKYIIWEKFNLDVQESVKMYFFLKKKIAIYTCNLIQFFKIVFFLVFE